MPEDAYTMEMRLCDDEGMVSFTTSEINSEVSYLGIINGLRSNTKPFGEHKPVTEPFRCTGSAHLMGEHIRCTSPVHHDPTPEINAAMRAGEPLHIQGRLRTPLNDLKVQRIITAAVAYRDAAPPMEQLTPDRAQALLGSIKELVDSVNDAGL